MLSRLHADRLPRGHAAVLRSSRLPAGAFPLGATQGLRVCRCFLALDPLIALGNGCFACTRCHGIMSTCSHAVIWTPAEPGVNRRTRRGQEQPKEDGGQGRGQQEDKTRTRRGQKERNRDGLAAAPAWKKHKKRTTGGHRVHWRGQAGHQQRRRRGQSEDIHCFPASRTALILLKWLW